MFASEYSPQKQVFPLKKEVSPQLEGSFSRKATLCQTKTGAISPTGDGELERNLANHSPACSADLRGKHVEWTSNFAPSQSQTSTRVCNVPCIISVCMCVSNCMCTMCFDFDTNFNSSPRVIAHNRCILGAPSHIVHHACVCLPFLIIYLP